MKANWAWYVYILECKDHSLYVGMTWNLDIRMLQHSAGVGGQYTKKHGFRRLLFFEEYENIYEARKRENQIKGWRREKKWQLILGKL